MKLEQLSASNNGVYIIAEIGLNHNGSIEIAKRLIDVASETGCDAVKFQKRTVEKLAIKEALDAVDTRFPEFGSTYREIRAFLEFNFNQYLQLRQYAISKGLDFFVTPFDLEAVDFLEQVGVNMYKVASHSLTNIPLLQKLSYLSKPVILSTGMAEIYEIDIAFSQFSNSSSNLFLMHCVSSYPTPDEESNLKILDVLQRRYQNTLVGYSGHEIGILPTISAVSRGARLIERHITLDKKMPGFDHRISLEPSELLEMTSTIRRVEKIIGTGVKAVSDKELITRKKYHVSMVSSTFIRKGTKLTESMITYKNPGTGLPYSKKDIILGKIANADILPDQIITESMFD